jgi:hypothetical protein
VVAGIDLVPALLQLLLATLEDPDDHPDDRHTETRPEENP